MDDPRKRIPSQAQLAVLGRRNRRVSFGCGAILGFAVGLPGALGALEVSLGEAVATALLLAIALGALCAIFGDRLLERLVRWMSWWS
jgi:heme A synthase